MIPAFQSELIKLRRPLVLYGTLGAMTAIAVLATALAFALAGDSSTFNGGRPGSTDLSLPALAGPSGWTRGFVVGAGFGGVVLMIAFAASFASEFSGGTIRTLLLTEPRRLRLLGGKLLGLAALVAGGFLLAETASVVTALIAAPIRGVDTGQWFTLDGVRYLGSSYLDSVLMGLGWGIFGGALAMLVRSILPTLAVLLVWFFPFENILHNAWSTADKWFPGLLLQGLRPGGPTELTRGSAMLALYIAVTLVLSTWTFVRRDVTA